ncbi:MAG: serine/threonine protein kinase [Sandaracinus sp.]|nr:serine/threonine protein kinase [Sandaracinus sp.]
MSASPKPTDPNIGRVVADRFEVISLIGSGGMGSVYRARQRGLDRPVALKLLKEEASWDPDTVTRFHREAKAMSLLQHGNTVRVFDFGQTHEGGLFLAMELLEGETLTKRLTREGCLDPVLAIRIVQQILRSLHEAHSKGIIHRDLKPDNILLAEVDGHHEPVVKVLDFGIAKVFEGENQFDQLETQAGTVFGTPRYMSPEQAQGKSLDARSDLYSVGVLLYQLLTGVPPFQDEEAVVVMAKHIRDKPEPPIKVAPTRPISTSLNKATLKALEKDPGRRFQDAAEYARALEKCVADIEAFKHAHTGIFGRAHQHRTNRLALGIGAVVLLLSVGVAVWILSGDPEEAVAVAESAGPPLVPTTPQAPPEAPTPQSSLLESEPAGADVVLDGEIIGSTPFQRQLLPGDALELALELEGYETVETTLSAGQERTVLLTELPPEPEPSSRRRVRRRAAPMEPVAEEAAPSRMRDDPYTRLDY